MCSTFKRGFILVCFEGADVGFHTSNGKNPVFADPVFVVLWGCIISQMSTNDEEWFICVCVCVLIGLVPLNKGELLIDKDLFLHQPHTKKLQWSLKMKILRCN